MSDLLERLREEGLGFGIGPALLCQKAAAEITRLRADLAEAQTKIARLEAGLEILRGNPVAVHLNMLNGNIAKPTWEHIKHLYLAEFSAIPSA